MRWLTIVLGLLLAGVPAFAQTTSVSGTITDSGAQIWANGSYQFSFQPARSNPSGQYFFSGSPFNVSQVIAGVLDGTGSFAGALVPSNTSITPSGSTWSLQVCPAASTPCFSQPFTITGATQSVTGAITPPSIVLNLAVPFLGARAYTDPEVFGALPGTLYFNLTDNRMHVCLQTGFPPCTWFVLNGGGGTVSSVSSGNFSPLFNVTVATPTTTPAFSFTALNAAAGTIFGNPSGSPAPPSFNSPGSFSGIVSSVTGTSPITSTGGSAPAIACPTCVTSVSGTANQITSSGGTTPTLSIPATFVAPGTITATTSITDSGLTSGRCVQTGAAGLLTVTSGACGGNAILAAPTTCNLSAAILGIAGGTPQTVIACAATAPSSGCPCRAYVSWNIAGDGTSSTEQAEGIINDGTSNFAGTSSYFSNQITTGYQGMSRSDYSPNTYTNSQAVTFTLTAESDHTWNIRTATFYLGGPTQVRVTYLSSN